MKKSGLWKWKPICLECEEFLKSKQGEKEKFIKPTAEQEAANKEAKDKEDKELEDKLAKTLVEMQKSNDNKENNSNNNIDNDNSNANNNTTTQGGVLSEI